MLFLNNLSEVYRSKLKISLAIVLLLIIIKVNLIFANPEDGVVTNGEITFLQTSNKLTIEQHTEKAIIDWRTFNIAPEEQTIFIQPSSQAIILNRINTQEPSRIDGSLTANGQVIIINQHGILFGENAKIDVNGILATTTKIADQEFLTQRTDLNKFLEFNYPGRSEAKIVNAGKIVAEHLVGLVAPTVINSGVILATAGKVELASGEIFSLDLYGDDLIKIAVATPEIEQLIENSGEIYAAAGKVALTAAVGRTIIDHLISNKGILKADQIIKRHGEIVIAAQESNLGTKFGIKAHNVRDPVNNKLLANYTTPYANNTKTLIIKDLKLTGKDAVNYYLSPDLKFSGQVGQPELLQGQINLNVTTVIGEVGKILPKQLQVALKDQVISKNYDGTETANLTREHYEILGIVSRLDQPGGNLQLDQVDLFEPPKIGSYEDRHAGINKKVLVSAGNFQLSGVDRDNYSLPREIDLAANIGTIHSIPLPINADLKTKTYGKQDPEFTYTYLDQDLAPIDLEEINKGNSIFTGKLQREAGNQVGTYRIELGDLNAGGDYILNYTANQLVIEQQLLTVKLQDHNLTKVYEGNNQFILAEDHLLPLNSYIFEEFPDGKLVDQDQDFIRVQVTAATYADQFAGENKEVIISGLNLIGNNSHNYKLAVTEKITGKGTIKPKELLAMLTGEITKVYDGNSKVMLANDHKVSKDNYYFTTEQELASGANLPAISPIIAGDLVELIAADGMYVDYIQTNQQISSQILGKWAGNSKKLTLSGLELTGNGAKNYELRNPTATSYIGVIHPKELAVHLVNKVTKNYNGDLVAQLTLSNYELLGVVGEGETKDQVALLDPPIVGEYVDRNVGDYKRVKVLGENLQLALVDQFNYTLPQSLEITGDVGEIRAVPLFVSAVQKTKIYGEDDPLLTYTYLDPQTGDDHTILSGGLTREVGQNAGIYKIIQGNLQVNSNYYLVFNTNTLIIEKLPLNLKLDLNIDKIYDGTADLLLEPDQILPLSNYTLSPGLLAKDQGLVRVQVNKATYLDRVVDQHKTINATGLNLIDHQPNGKFLISDNYALLNMDATGAGSILLKDLTVELFGTISKNYDQKAEFLLDRSNYQFKGKILNDDLDLDHPIGYYIDQQACLLAADRVNYNSKRFDLPGLALTGNDVNNYRFLTKSLIGEGVIFPVPVTILDVDVADKIYDGTTNTEILRSSITFAGKFPGDDLSLNIGELSSRFLTPNAGVDQVVMVDGLALAGAQKANYILNETSFHKITATIYPKELNVFGTNKIKDYGAADPVFTYTYKAEDLVSADLALAKEDKLFSGKLSRVAGENAGTYNIILDPKEPLTAGKNYTIVYQNGTFQINPQIINDIPASVINIIPVIPTFEVKLIDLAASLSTPLFSISMSLGGDGAMSSPSVGGTTSTGTTTTTTGTTAGGTGQTTTQADDQENQDNQDNPDATTEPT